MPLLQAQTLTDFVRDIFLGAGARAADADLVARSLVNTNLTGHDSHGVVRVPQYIESIHNGDLDPLAEPAILQETPVMAHVDGQRCLGQVAANFAARTAITKAKAMGMAAVGVRNTGHIGRLGEWVELAARDDLVGLGYCNGGRPGGFVTPHNGAGRCLGTNPIAAAFPLPQREPILMDFATSAVAEGKIRVARNAGAPVPPGLILNAEGLPSTDPDELYDGGMLLPAAGHKGYGLGLMMELLAGALTASGCSAFPEYQRGNGALFIVLRADLFQPMDGYLESARRMADAALAVPAAPGCDPVVLPGDPERTNAARRRRDGIPIDETTWAQLCATAAGVDVAPPAL